MLRNTKILSIMPISMGNVLKSPFKLKDLLNQNVHYLKEPPISSSCFITQYSGLLIGFAIHNRFDRYVRLHDLK